MATVLHPEYIAHADWGTDPKKRQVATATRTSGGNYRVVSLAPADPIAVANGDLRGGLHVPRVTDGQVLVGFDFPIGLPRAYAEAAGVGYFPDLLLLLRQGPWDRFYDVASVPEEVAIHRPFYPARPGGTSQAQLFDGLGLTRDQLRRRCEGRDAAMMFWTLGGNQVGKASLAGWRFLAAAPPGSVRLWPFAGPLEALLGDGSGVVVVETYPREFYRYIKPEVAPSTPWSKRRLADRLQWMPRLLEWAESLGVEWDGGVSDRVEAGFSAGHSGEDEFDPVVGLLGMIAAIQPIGPPHCPGSGAFPDIIEDLVPGGHSYICAPRRRYREV